MQLPIVIHLLIIKWKWKFLQDFVAASHCCCLQGLCKRRLSFSFESKAGKEKAGETCGVSVLELHSMHLPVQKSFQFFLRRCDVAWPCLESNCQPKDPCPIGWIHIGEECPCSVHAKFAFHTPTGDMRVAPLSYNKPTPDWNGYTVLS